MLIKVNYYSLSPRRFIVGTKSSYGFETLDFDLSDEWLGLTKTIVFYASDGTSVSVEYNDTPILIPDAVTARAGLAKFVLEGQATGKRLVSITGYLDILDTADPATDGFGSP